MDFITITIEILKSLSIIGGFGVGIILLTVLVRLAMWPLGVSQQRSMRTMQMLQPKMKAIQERYKNDGVLQGAQVQPYGWLFPIVNTNAYFHLVIFSVNESSIHSNCW